MGTRGTDAVEAFLAALEHPLQREIVALRRILLDADPAIGEEIKWNAPSFRTTQHFATMQLRRRDVVRLILHLGANKRALPREAIADPHGLLEWLGPDRAIVGFRSAAELAAGEVALVAIVRQWLRHV
ncbi:MAG: DUF1801 domain-containing protein [Rhodanobacter sp.]|uniref:DUF1801 domain-containing protein n=1 Tax=Rhodanobacter sp. KK11 TaxID=3083255 RepID=UPI002966D9A5|nr:DUF1801 domain-containing protein [Rhodanobacter sp. KK11]MDW2980017.1 DUF1801 domain-containing protein [Rhodanobacter sp. KK11]